MIAFIVCDKFVPDLCRVFFVFGAHLGGFRALLIAFNVCDKFAPDLFGAFLGMFGAHLRGFPGSSYRMATVSRID